MIYEVNNILKAKIVEKYGFQAAFAEALDVHTGIVSRVVMERHGNHQSDSMQEIFKYRFRHIYTCSELVDILLKNISQ